MDIAPGAIPLHRTPPALARVWRARCFSWSLTRLMHRFPEDGSFERAMQVAELDSIASSRAAQLSIAGNGVGLLGRAPIGVGQVHATRPDRLHHPPGQRPRAYASCCSSAWSVR